MKKFLTAALAASLALTMFTACGKEEAEGDIYIPVRTGNSVNYDTVRASVGTILEQATLEGRITNPYSVNLSFMRVGGKISAINVREDYEVTEGEVIAVIDGTDLESEINIQKIRLDSAQSTYDTLVSTHADSDEIEFAKIELDIEQIKYDELIEKRGFLELKAPFDGRITSVGDVRVGSTVDKFDRICTISDSSKTRLTVTDYENRLSDIVFGTRVEIAQGTLASTTGKVVDTLTSDWRDRDGNRITVNTYVIQCDEDIEFLDLGGIEVTFTTLRRDDAVIVPSEAVYEATEVFSDDSTGLSNNYVNVLINGIKVQTPVNVGVSSNGKTEILDGLEGTETLILS